MKKVIAKILCVALVMVLGLAACGKGKKIENPNLIYAGDSLRIF